MPDGKNEISYLFGKPQFTVLKGYAWNNIFEIILVFNLEKDSNTFKK